MRFSVFVVALIATCAIIRAVRGEDGKPLPQPQLRLLLLPGDKEKTVTITRPHDDQTTQQKGVLISCESMTLDQGQFIFTNGTLETSAGDLTFAEIAVTFSGTSMSISSPTPNKGIKDIHFRLKPGVTINNDGKVNLKND